MLKRILLLEDDLSLIDGLTFALKKQGFEVEAKRTLADAKAAWRKGLFDLLILDVSLPDGTGFDFCRFVRQSSEEPILFLTASDEEINVIMGLDMGGDDYVTKPFKLGILLSRMNALLRRTKSVNNENDTLSSNGIDVIPMQGQAFRRRNIGFIFQAFNLIPELTVEQNMIFPEGSSSGWLSEGRSFQDRA